MKTSKVVIITLTVCATLFVLMLTCSKPTGSHNYSPPPKEKPLYLSHNVDQALWASREYVKEQLKAPATAEFGQSEKDGVVQINDSTFKVTGYVDSQNSFGAMIRSKYYCWIIYTPNNTTICKNLMIE